MYGDATRAKHLVKVLGLLEQQLSGLNLGAGLLRKTWRECFVLQIAGRAECVADVPFRAHCRILRI